VLAIESRVTVPNLTASEVTRFMLDCSDATYQKWWPGVHLHLHPLAPGGADHVGDTVFMDEFIGSRRLRMTGVVVHAEPGRKISWQMKKGIRLPAWLTIEVADRASGVAITHTITAGWGGVGRLLDPLLRLYLSSDFAAAMDRHVHTEFPLIRDRLHPAVE
jgi:hypothetical protein